MRPFVALPLLLAAVLWGLPCTAEQAPVPEDLAGAEFLLVDIGGHGVVEECQSTLKFESVERVVGNGGCNRYFGAVELNGDAIKFGPLGVTERACPKALVMDQEKRFLAALGEAYRIVTDEAYLIIYSKAPDATLKFARLVKDPGERKKE